MRTFVSKNTLPSLGSAAVKDEARRQGTSQFAQAAECPFSALVAAHVEGSAMRHSNLHLVAVLQFQRIDNRGGERTAKLFPHLETCMMPP